MNDTHTTEAISPNIPDWEKIISEDIYRRREEYCGLDRELPDSCYIAEVFLTKEGYRLQYTLSLSVEVPKKHLFVHAFISINLPNYPISSRGYFLHVETIFRILEYNAGRDVYVRLPETWKFRTYWDYFLHDLEYICQRAKGYAYDNLVEILDTCRYGEVLNISVWKGTPLVSCESQDP